MLIKELGIENIEEIKALFYDIFTKEPWNDDWSDENQLHNYMQDLIGNVNSLTFGLYEEDELIGFSLGSIMHWYMGTEYYIYEFCIKTEKQGRGIGTAFINEIEEYAKGKGATHIYLQTERMAPAFDFYMKNGFVELKGHVSLFKMFE